jgi:MFS family permease
MSVSALMLAQIVLTAGTSLQTLLLPVRAAAEGFPTLIIGAVGSAHNIGFAAGCLLVPRLVARFGHGRAFAALALLAATVALGYAATAAPGAWIILRLITGLCMAGLSMVVESWINLRAGNSRRGRTLAVYAIAGAVAGVGGQMLLPIANPHGVTLFAVVAAALLLSSVPVLLARDAPPAHSAAALSLRRLYAISPVGIVGCLFIGLANGAFWQLAPVYAEAHGLSSGGVAVFMSLVTLAGAVAQWPIGRLSDRRDRRRVMLGCLAAGIVADLLMSAPGLGPGPTLAAATLYGICVLPIYSLCVAHTNDVLGREHCVAASGGLLLAFGAGAVVGPLLAAALMASAGTAALFGYTAAVHVAFAGFVAWRMKQRSVADLPGIAGARAQRQAAAAQHGHGGGSAAGGERTTALVVPDRAGGVLGLG